MKPAVKTCLTPRNIQFLLKKLEAGEISAEECKEIIKRIMAQKHKHPNTVRENAPFQSAKTWLLNLGKKIRDKVLDLSPIDSSLNKEELLGMVRRRQF